MPRLIHPENLDTLARGLCAEAEVKSPRPVILIDGRSGSGKSTLADAMRECWPGRVTLVRLDDIYPGWDGLEQGARHVAEWVLNPETPRWQQWDWQANKPLRWRTIDESEPLIVEGCGALSRASAPRATLRLWLELDAESRKRRALARDGQAYEPFWDRWAAQEREYLAAESPVDLADVSVDMSSVDLAAR